MPREMALKKRLVDRDVLEAHDPLFLFDLENPIHQQERVAVGENLHDVFYGVHPFLLSSGFHHLTYQGNRPAMARLHRHDPSPHFCPRQREVSHAVHRLVPHELVAPAQVAAENVVVVEYDGVVERGSLDQTLGPESIHLVHETESSGSRKLARECVLGDVEAARLFSDKRMWKLDGYVELESVEGIRLVDRGAVDYPDRLAEGQKVGLTLH